MEVEMVGFAQTLSGTGSRSRFGIGPLAPRGRAAAVALTLILAIVHGAPAHSQQPAAAQPAAGDAGLTGPGLVPNGGLPMSNASAGVAQAVRRMIW